MCQLYEVGNRNRKRAVGTKKWVQNFNGNINFTTLPVTKLILKSYDVTVNINEKRRNSR